VTGKLTRRLAKFAAMTLEASIEPEHVEPFVRRKAALQEDIEALQRELDTLKMKRKATPHHIPFDELPDPGRDSHYWPSPPQNGRMMPTTRSNS
jgi:hypothetical protein